MEKKGDLLNQLAIIVDLIEKMNINGIQKTISIKVDDEEFINLFNYFQSKNERKMQKPIDTFTINMETVDIIISKNNA